MQLDDFCFTFVSTKAVFGILEYSNCFGLSRNPVQMEKVATSWQSSISKLNLKNNLGKLIHFKTGEKHILLSGRCDESSKKQVFETRDCSSGDKKWCQALPGDDDLIRIR